MGHHDWRVVSTAAALSLIFSGFIYFTELWKTKSQAGGDTATHTQLVSTLSSHSTKHPTSLPPSCQAQDLAMWHMRLGMTLSGPDTERSVQSPTGDCTSTSETRNVKTPDPQSPVSWDNA